MIDIDMGTVADVFAGISIVWMIAFAVTPRVMGRHIGRFLGGVQEGRSLDHLPRKKRPARPTL